jgi:hypothetical protein
MNPQPQLPGFCFPGFSIGSRATGVKQRFFWNKEEFVFRAVGANLDETTTTEQSKKWATQPFIEDSQKSGNSLGMLP